MHGRCSIGSLGKESQEAGVRDVTVKTTTFTGTENGLRIKTWGRPSNGFATNILFQHVVMNNVKNPILIDQNYCPGKKNCPGQVCQIYCLYTLSLISSNYECKINIKYTWIFLLISCALNRLLVWKSAMWPIKTFMEHQLLNLRWNLIVAENIRALGLNCRMWSSLTKINPLKHHVAMLVELLPAWFSLLAVCRCLKMN